MHDHAHSGRESDLSLGLWQSLHAIMLQHMATITLGSLVQEQLDKGVMVEAKRVRLAISTPPVVKPVRTRAPNSVFALGRSLAA
jgi:Rrf2 family iron-sulfur cluster assembly transcriptional regulator